MRRTFGLWLLTGPRSFDDPRIFREGLRGELARTPFQRAVGVRYLGRSVPLAPDSLVGFGSFSRSRPYSVLRAFKKHFQTPLRPQDLSLKSAHAAVLRRSTGYAIVSSRHLRQVSLPFAQFIGIIRLNGDGAS